MLSTVQGFPSSQGVADGDKMLSQPTPGKHISTVQELPSSGHVNGVPVWQRAPRQAAPSVHGSPSLQALPSGAISRLQIPVSWWQRLILQFSPLGGQMTTGVELHSPPSQTPTFIHALSLSQGAPSARTLGRHSPVSG
jgi:hypothetical protein